MDVSHEIIERNGVIFFRDSPERSEEPRREVCRNQEESNQLDTENIAKSENDIAVDTYSTALIIALSTSQTLIINYPIFEYLLAKILHDNNQVYDVIVNNIPMLIEHLIPRVPRTPRQVCDKITPENYDNAKFVDWFSPDQSTAESLMTREEFFEIFGEILRRSRRAALHLLLWQQRLHQLPNPPG